VKRFQSARRVLALLGVTACTLGALGVAAPGVAGAGPLAAATTTSGCRLNSAGDRVHHVIYLVFDNVHLTRDNPNVPSDLEQMPHLRNFIEDNGALFGNNHTQLISHTATGILDGFTGVYGDRHGQPISNSFRYFKPDGTSNPAGSFAYWTDPLNDLTNPAVRTDNTPQMINEAGKTAPAPWVPYTRAGCSVGAAGAANIVLENIGTDIPTVFGANSPEAAEVQANPTRATADFVGIAVHCAQGASPCEGASGARPDLLPDEPGGYQGFQALFGHKYVAPQVSPNGPLVDLNGNPIQDPSGNLGFPGFDGMSAAVSLSYVASMQEHGVPVTYAYLSDTHDNHPTGPAFGPGQAGYEAALRSYDDAFAKFLARLRSHGIDQSNTTFVVTADEGDHFAGVQQQGCDGVTTPCTYGPGQIGELNANATGLLATQRGNLTPFTVHSDSAPNFYVTGNPARDAAVTRGLEHDVAALTASNPYKGGASEQVVDFLADPVEMKLLHMLTADPARVPTFTAFAKPDYFMFAGAPNCNAPCVAINPAFAWNHGDFAPEINRTWLGLVGPGVRHVGLDNTTWLDQTDVRPTMLTLIGLRDDYRHDGRTVVEALDTSALPVSLRAHQPTMVALARVYKQLNASVGSFGSDTLTASTRALKSGSASDDHTYQSVEAALQALGAGRDTVAGQIKAALDDAAFAGRLLDEPTALRLIVEGKALLAAAHVLAVSS
jgi:hypothetical protein